MKKICISALVLISGVALLYANTGMTFEMYQKAAEKSYRNVSLTKDRFDKFQKQKEAAIVEMERYLTEKFGTADMRIVRAFSELPREYFTYNYQTKQNSPEVAYSKPARTLAIGWGSALSDYLGQAYMTQMVNPGPNDVVLEIGTGSGFQSAWLSKLVKETYSIEIIEPLGNGVKNIYAPLGITNVKTRVGDGFYGWPEVTGGFDIIIVTCAAQYVPPALLKQLKPKGRMIIPIGQPFRRGQFYYIYTKDAAGNISSRKDIGCYFIPMTGAMFKK